MGGDEALPGGAGLSVSGSGRGTPTGGARSTVERREGEGARQAICRAWAVTWAERSWATGRVGRRGRGFLFSFFI